MLGLRLRLRLGLGVKVRFGVRLRLGLRGRVMVRVTPFMPLIIRVNCGVNAVVALYWFLYTLMPGG